VLGGVGHFALTNLTSKLCTILCPLSRAIGGGAIIFETKITKAKKTNVKINNLNES
jgi:hypothetical protein